MRMGPTLLIRTRYLKIVVRTAASGTEDGIGISDSVRE